MGSPQHVYAANLRVSLGYPLYSPGLSRGLEEPYCKEGVQIGDVCYVNGEGEFNPLFNIGFFLPPDQGDRYPSYEPVKFELYRKSAALAEGQVFMYGVQRNLDTPWPYEFIAKSKSGAILILPSGATLSDLQSSCDLEAFRKFAAKYARRWCEISEKDSLYLITGTYKTSNFSLAAFNAGHLDGKIRVEQDKDTGTYKWKSDFEIYCRIGPQNNQYDNQTIFIKGFRMVVRWRWFAVIERVTRSESPIVRTIASFFATLLALLEALFVMANGWLSRTTVEHSQISQPLHPSDIINRYLLDKNPGASVAITHDNEWIDMLEKKILSPRNLMREDCVRDCLAKGCTSSAVDDECIGMLKKEGFSQEEHPSYSGHDHLGAATAWINASEGFHHPTTLLAYRTVLPLLVHHLASLPSFPHHLTLLNSLPSSLATDAFSACLRNRSPTTAVELLEQGRGIYWSQLTRFRSPLQDVVASGPEGKILADQFTRLNSLSITALASPGADQHDRMWHLNVELQRIVSNIRELPGLAHFLLPSLFSDLQRAASCGPVIIVNASQYSCDALIVFADKDPVHIPLSVTKQDVREQTSKLRTLTMRGRRSDVTRDLGLLLRELWDRVVFPIVDFLLTVYPVSSRIWWCPTAEFCLLPLHAAGPYRKGQRNLSNLYISSYTSTLAALTRARRPISPTSARERKHFIAIGQANAIGTSEFASVSIELAGIGRLVDGLATFTRIEGQDSCISRVADELGKNEWVHLACHGISNKKQPFGSALALQDGHFTIERIIQCDLQNPEFAYLSGCHATVGVEESPGEVIHLASAMQFAGFRSVIGTMWAVDDAEASKVTTVFYTYMMDESGRLDHTRAAVALSKTMESLDIPLDQQILYMHFGA